MLPIAQPKAENQGPALTKQVVGLQIGTAVHLIASTKLWQLLWTAEDEPDDAAALFTLLKAELVAVMTDSPEQPEAIRLAVKPWCQALEEGIANSQLVSENASKAAL